MGGSQQSGVSGYLVAQRHVVQAVPVQMQSLLALPLIQLCMVGQAGQLLAQPLAEWPARAPADGAVENRHTTERQGTVCTILACSSRISSSNN